jgi:hypothetical protein
MMNGIQLEHFSTKLYMFDGIGLQIRSNLLGYEPGGKFDRQER